MGAGEAASASGSSHANASEPRSDAQTAVDTPAEQARDAVVSQQHSPVFRDPATFVGLRLKLEPAQLKC